ncbi:MAG: asparaginase [Ignavibacteriales bacterium]|nr:asparaginase [Ignavibacteriales bacterium]
MKIQLFITGGTFDKEYDELTGKLFFKDSHLKEMLQIARNKVELDIKTLMMMDSLDMTDDDRKIIALNCKKSEHTKILITHGTDTMVDTAKVIAKLVKDKTIVITGAMIPYTFGSSDGLFNLGASIVAVQTLPIGVYICMNGRIFNYNKVRKNKKIGIFEEIEK